MDFALDPTSAPHGVPPIDFRAQLNDEQFAAVTAAPGPLLVLAGAGSGKTRTLTYRVAYLLSQGVRPSEILLLTFTNKAAKEMLHRVQDLTGIEPGAVIFDPIKDFLGSGVNTDREDEVRPVLTPLLKLTEECGTAAIGLHHLNKSLKGLTPFLLFQVSIIIL